MKDAMRLIEQRQEAQVRSTLIHAAIQELVDWQKGISADSVVTSEMVKETTARVNKVMDGVKALPEDRG